MLGICGVSTDSGKYSISLTSTTLESRTACWPEDSPTTEDTTPFTPNHLSVVSRASFRRTTTTSYAFFKSQTTASYPSGSTRFHRSWRESWQILFVTFTALGSMKNSIVFDDISLNRGFGTQIWTQEVANSTARRLMVTRSRLNANRGIYSTRIRWNNPVT